MNVQAGALHADDAGGRAHWINWSGSVRARPARIARPTTHDELARVVVDSVRVRATGAGHSFTPLCETDGTLVSLDALPGALAISPNRRRVRAPAGWSLRRLTAALWDEGLSLANQGDVNPQSLAGSIATGTHGTSRTLGSLASFARGFRLLLADGRLLWCDADHHPDLYEAQRLSLGLLGIAVEIEVEVVPAFYLAEHVEKRRFDEVAEAFDTLAEENRHVEFFLFPHADHVILKRLNIADPCNPPSRGSDVDEKTFRRICQLSRAVPPLVPTLHRMMMRSNMDAARAGAAHAIFPSERSIRFEEMEYEVPVANGMAALREAVDWIRRRRLPVAFPFEYRVVAPDDIWMSPMNAGPVASISMHQYAPMEWRRLFAEAEPIFRAAGGRPHWAKRHNLTREDVDTLYPMAERFRAQRRDADPSGKFMNTHLAALFS